MDNLKIDNTENEAGLDGILTGDELTLEAIERDMQPKTMTRYCWSCVHVDDCNRQCETKARQELTDSNGRLPLVSIGQGDKRKDYFG